MTADTLTIREQFIEKLRRHLDGWKQKVLEDFSEGAFKGELQSLMDDEVYAQFHLACEEYVLIRLMGRVSISIGRRLGEIYDKIPRLLVLARYQLEQKDVALVFSKLRLDIGVPFAKLSKLDLKYVSGLVQQYLGIETREAMGLGIEVRYNFNPNDSARLRKDCEMAALLQTAGYAPIYLVFSSISPRDEAIARLKRAGWSFLVGDEAICFMKDLCNMDFRHILEDPVVSSEVKKAIGDLMGMIYGSSHMQKVAKKYAPASTVTVHGEGAG